MGPQHSLRETDTYVLNVCVGYLNKAEYHTEDYERQASHLEIPKVQKIRKCVWGIRYS
jgi:hypothetical protein